LNAAFLCDIIFIFEYSLQNLLQFARGFKKMGGEQKALTLTAPDKVINLRSFRQACPDSLKTKREVNND